MSDKDAVTTNKDTVTSIPKLTEEQVKKDEFEIKFSGEAFTEIERLRTELVDVETAKDVILKALAVLINARGKDMILKDKSTGISETVVLWKNKGG